MTSRTPGRRLVLGGIVLLAMALVPVWPASASPDTSDEDRTLSPYFFVFREDTSTDTLPLKRTWAEVDIVGVIADVTVVQEYANEGDSTLEAVYVFPGSTRAAVYAMTMTVGERVIEAEIREREQAREEYEQALEQGKTASLLEQQRPNVFQMNVGNILPGDVITVEMSYTELLVPEEGQYEFVYPTVVGPRYSNDVAGDVPESEAWVENPYLRQWEDGTFPFGLELTLFSGIPIAKMHSPSHFVEVDYASAHEASVSIEDSAEAGTSDFVLRYGLAGGDIESGLLLYPGEEESFFLLMVEPPARIETRDIVPREYIYILDVSGSMFGFPLDVSKELMRETLGQLRPIDSFNILFFAGGSALYAEESLPATQENVDKALETFEAMRGGGGTELLPALNTALDLPRAEEGVSRIVVLATDGYVTVEDEAFEVVRRRLGEANLFPFGIGSSVNRHLIEGLAHAGMGEPFVALNGVDAGKQAERFREYVSSPVLQGVEVAFEGLEVYDVEPPAVPDLFASRPVVVFGKFEGPAEGCVTVTGYTADGPIAAEIDLADAVISEDHDALQYLWARHRVRRLDDLVGFGEDPERDAEVTELGLRYNLLTRLTSFVAVDRVVRADGTPEETVKQPLPLPAGVSEHAVGYRSPATPGTGAGLLGVKSHGGSSGGGYGMAAGAVGQGYGTSGTGEGMSASKVATKVVPSVANPIILGSLDKSVIDRTIKQHLAVIRHCYQKRLQANPDLQGKIVIKFTIGEDGLVTDAEVKESTMGDEALEEAILEVFERMKFPEPAGGGTVIVSYPFIFSSS